MCDVFFCTSTITTLGSIVKGTSLGFIVERASCWGWIV